MAKHLPRAPVAGPVQSPTFGEGREKSLGEDPLLWAPLQFGSERPENPLVLGCEGQNLLPSGSPTGGAAPALT